MSDSNTAQDGPQKSPEKKAKYQPPKGASRTLQSAGVEYRATADWLVLKKKEKPTAEMFFVSYHVDQPRRPITFVFNGGPGAASAYLHVGAMGPQRVQLGDDGLPPPPPTRPVENTETWLSFTDLVFIDPVGTGFSRPIEDDEKEKKKENTEYYDVQRDLDSLCEFISQYLSKFSRWEAPIFIAGESYGGYRVAKLSRQLQESYGVGISASILISPAIEMSDLSASDYDSLRWLDTLPSFAATAAYHKRSRYFDRETPLESVLSATEEFIGNDLCRFLVQGASMSTDDRAQIARKMADMIGLPEELIAKSMGRVDFSKFAREILRDQERVVGWYDGSLSGVDPFPDRVLPEGPDPTLSSFKRTFSRVANLQIRQTIGLETDRDYKLLNMDVHAAWNFGKTMLGVNNLGGADDLRYAMALNPHMRVVVAHGYLDLITPYYTSKRIVNHMKLHPDLADKIIFKNYFGGHMFYTWDKVRKLFFEDMRSIYQ